MKSDTADNQPNRKISRRWRLRASFESVKMAMAAIRGNKLRAVLTCVGIIIGVATVIAMMSIVNGIDGIMTKELNRIGANSFFLKKYPSIQISMNWRKYHTRKDLDLEDAKAIRANCPSVELVSPTMLIFSQVVRSGNEKTDPTVFLAGGESTYSQVVGLDMQEGRSFTQLEDASPRYVAMLGTDVVDRLFPYGSPVGRMVHVGGFELRVIGVLEKRGSIFGESQDNMAVIPLQTLIKKFPVEDHMEISVKARPDASIGKAMDEVRGLMRVRHKLKANEDDDFEIETRDSITKAWANMTGSIFAAAVGIAMISLLVGGVGIMNIMLVSVTERTKEIGIRKALGARRKDILRQFLIEATSISSLGGILGVLLGIGGLKIAGAVTDKLPIRTTTFAVILSLSFSILVGIFFGVYPARKAAKLDPIDALRYE